MIKKIIVLLLISTSCYAGHWECVEISWSVCRLKRMEVPNGWIVKYEGLHEYSIAFVPDVNHEWKL